MAVVRGIFAVLIGSVVALVLGATYDYFKINFSFGLPDPNQWQMLWPWFFAVPGAVSAIIAVVLNNIWSRKATAKPAAAKPVHQAKTAPKAKTTSSDVPGMPTFDLEELKANDKKTENLG
ncbi:hypothetical protein JW859_03055 [bacterium]|nr:hypothetical protein [bacterium]